MRTAPSSTPAARSADFVTVLPPLSRAALTARGLSLLFGGLLLAPLANAADQPIDWALCGPRLGFPWEVALPATAPGTEPESQIEADSFDVSGKDLYRLEGDVELRRGDQRLRADRAEYRHSSSEFSAQGEVQLQDPELALQATSANGQLSQNRTELENVEYRLIGLRGNGEAKRLARHGDTSELDALSYTTCNPVDPRWQLRAKTLKLDHEKGVGVARGATLRLGSVPFLWLPYARFPIDDRRQTGLLFPSFGYSDDNGIDLRQPLYLNLAPNYDATISPRLLGRRGVMLGAEFRHLGESSQSQIEGNWLPDDDLTNTDRGSFRLRHYDQFNPHWYLSADVNQVSDDRYFEDFGDSLSTRSTTLLQSQAGLYGRGLGWRASLEARDWDVTDPIISDRTAPYRQLPRARLSIDRWAQLVHYGANLEAVEFSHAYEGSFAADRPGASRYDLEPWVELPLERAAGYIKPRLAWRHTGYSLDRGWRCQGTANCAAFAGRQFDDLSPTRNTAISSIDAALNFERDSSLFGTAMLNTLQPRLFYLHVPYEDQRDIPLFDTDELTFGYDSLFRDNRFSGADRQGDADQLTIALTSRWFEQVNGRERLALSLGQIRYFENRRVSLPNSGNPNYFSNADGSDYVATADLVLNDQWRLGLGYQWNPEIDRATVSGTRLSWRGNSGALANLSYRYRRSELEQIDGSFVFPVAEQWRLVGRWNYSLLDDTTLEAFGGVEWRDCCVALRILSRHYLRNREGEKNNALFFELELKGLASFGRDAADFLERAMLGYSR